MENPINLNPGLDVSAFLKLVHNPAETQEVFNLIRTLNLSPGFLKFAQCFIARAEADEGLQKLYRDRYMPRFPTNEELLQNPEGSFGRALAHFLIENNITLDFQGIDKFELYDRNESLLEYTRIRTLRLHDIIHVLTGADTTPAGEAKVGAFQLAQYGSALHTIVVSFLSMHVALHDSAKIIHCNDLVHEGYAMGLRSVPVFGVPWEEYFAENLELLRARFWIS